MDFLYDVIVKVSKLKYQSSLNSIELYNDENVTF